MILDQLINASLYQFSNPRIAQGLEFLQSSKFASLALGRTEIDGDHLFAIMQGYSTRPESECFWEAHRKYIDIQFLISGHERIDHAVVSSLQIVEPYDPAVDRMKLSGSGSVLELHPQMFTIFFPHDAHRPCMAAGQTEPVRKIVIKVEV